MINSNTVWYYSSLHGGDDIKAFTLFPANRIAGVKGKNLYSAGTPLIDYMMFDNRVMPRKKHLSFNPLLDYDTNRSVTPDYILERNRRKCYFQIELFVLYSEEELYNLKEIAVKNRDSGIVSTEKIIDKKGNVVQSNVTNQTNQGKNPLDQTEAVFSGGSDAMLQYIFKTLKYPVVAEENGIQGEVIVQFDVETDGSITNIAVKKSIDPSLDKEALRVVRNMPKWTPATKDGVAISSHQTISIPFRLL